jgi:hypothetical protein
MDTMTAPAAPPPDTLRRHDSRWIAGAVICLLVAAAAAVQGYLLRYQPLSAKGTGSYGVDQRFASSRGEFTSPSGESFTAYDVRYQDGQTFSFSFTIGNLGRLPVTIDSVTMPSCEGCVFPLEYISTSLSPPSGPDMFDSTKSAPFAPFRLDPNGYRLVEVGTRFDHCQAWTFGSSTTSSLIEVRYHTGWVHHSVWLTLPYTLTVAFTGSSCQD